MEYFGESLEINLSLHRMIVTLFGHWDALDILLTTFSKVRNRH
jgi:hypothetical protein